MSEKEKRILETFNKVVKPAPPQTKDYLLGWVEGAASAVSTSQQTQQTGEDTGGKETA